MQAMRTGKLRALAVTSESVAFTPELPTLSEEGVKGFAAANWWGISSSGAAALIDKVDADIVKALATPDVKTRLGELGVKRAEHAGAVRRIHGEGVGALGQARQGSEPAGRTVKTARNNYRCAQAFNAA